MTMMTIRASATAGQQARASRIARSLKRLGFQMTSVGRAFKVTDPATGLLAVGSAPKMTLAEIEKWIGGHIKPKL
jgi:hypothetical protein